MSATRGLRIGIAGATGALGTEVLGALDASRLRVAQLVAVAGDRSLGTELDFQGQLVPVGTELPALHGLDLMLCCAPPAAAPEIARAALRAEVPCIDVSGAFAAREEVPLVWAAGGDPVAALPLVASPVDAALFWLPVLRALAAPAPPVRVSGTVLEAASASGRAAIDALSLESMALFNQQEPPEEAGIGRPLAFDCHPTSGELTGGRRAREAALASALGRLLPRAPAVSARWVQVPAFVGAMASLELTWEAPVDAAQARESLAKAPGVELWSAGDEGPHLRAAAGRVAVLAAPPEPDPADARTLRLWLAADPLRLAAANAIALALGRVEAGAARPA